MLLDKLFEFLSDKGFQNPDTGLMFFPAYIYTYDPKDEYRMRTEIQQLIEKLKRPNNSLECLVLNMYETFIEYLKNNSFAGDSNLLDDILKMETENPDDALAEIMDEVHGGFIDYIEELTYKHFHEVPNDKRVYLIVYGMGSIFPYLRTSELLKKTEKLIKKFKIIVFYPGEVYNDSFSLFNQLSKDYVNERIYRVNHINKVV